MDSFRYWVVARDGRGKWGVHYDPRGTIPEGGDVRRFQFEYLATEYLKGKQAAEKAAKESVERKQQSLMGDVQGE